LDSTQDRNRSKLALLFIWALQISIMKLLLLLVVLIETTFSAPAPFPIDDLSENPNDQVEVLGGPIRSNGEADADGLFPSGVRVIIVRRPSFTDFEIPDFTGDGQSGFGDAGFNFRQGGFNFGDEGFNFNDGGFNPFTFLRGGDTSDEETDTTRFNPFSLFGESAPGEDGKCGMLCQVLRIFEGKMEVLQGEIDILNKEMHENKNDTSVKEDEEFDVNQKECNEEVLEDGSVVKKCHTTISDADDDGNGFLFHHSVVHVTSGDESDGSVDTTNETNEETPIVTGDNEQEDIPEVTEIDENTESEFPENKDDSGDYAVVDPSENEIDGDLPEEVDGIDDGLLKNL